MKHQALTDSMVRAAMPGPKRVKLVDGRGLILKVETSGSKLWTFNYQFEGKQKALPLGAYPTVTLATARRRAADARDAVVRGIDPNEYRRASAALPASDGMTFAECAASLLTRKVNSGRAEGTITRDKRTLAHIERLIGSKPMKTIGVKPMSQALIKIAEHKRETAHRARALIGEVFRHAMALGEVEADPSPALRGLLPDLDRRG